MATANLPEYRCGLDEESGVLTVWLPLPEERAARVLDGFIYYGVSHHLIPANGTGLEGHEVAGTLVVLTAGEGFGEGNDDSSQ